jgi:hypothetical protein
MLRFASADRRRAEGLRFRMMGVERTSGETGATLPHVVHEALSEGPFAMRQLATESGLSYDVLRSWRSRRRRPNAVSAARLAAGLRQRAEQLNQLAAAIEDEISAAGRG